MTSRFFFRDADYPNAPGSPFYPDIEGAIRAAIRACRAGAPDQVVMEAGSKPYPVKVRDIPAAKARGLLGKWTD